MAYKISGTAQKDYLDEHAIKANIAIQEVLTGLATDNASQVIDGISSLQWQERSLLVGCRRMMQQAGFSENDLGLRPLLDYKE